MLKHGDCAAIDINMGCPKHFAMHGGMGAALLQDLDGAVGLMKRMRDGIPHHVPLSCKIRLLESVDATVAFIRRLEAVGVDAVGVHLRSTEEDSDEVMAR